MFRALVCPSSGASDCDVDYHIGHLVLGLLYVGSYSKLKNKNQLDATYYFIVFLIIIIIFIYCNWVVTRWQWLFYM